MKTHKQQLDIQAERLLFLAFKVDPEIKKALVKICVEIEMIGDRIESEHAAMSDVLAGIKNSLNEVLK